jgi:hypothetical protein
MNEKSATASEFSWVASLVYFLVAYVLVTVLAAGSTEVYRQIRSLPYAHEIGVGLLEIRRLPPRSRITSSWISSASWPSTTPGR